MGCLTLTVPFSTEDYKWVPAHLMLGRGNPVMSQYPIQGRVEVLLVTSCSRNLNKLQPDGPVVAYADLA